MQWFGGKRRIEVPCTVEIEQSGGAAHHDPVAVGHRGRGVVHRHLVARGDEQAPVLEAFGLGNAAAFARLLEQGRGAS
jgi:hypothetical protein